jgi:Putative transposase/Transposase zinc-binding domain
MPATALGHAHPLPARDAPGRPTHEYEPRRPEDTLLHRVVRTHLASFLERAAESHETGVPRFVDKELHGYLRCGVLAHGFCRQQCGGCSYERLVPLSCKGRALCPSCGGKRMTELAQHLSEQVIPHVPVRQFVLSLPHRLRYWLAYDHARSLSVLRVVVRAVFGFYLRAARGGTAADGRTGSVTFVQRFGSAGNLNLHFHIVVLDGVFAEAPDHSLRFHPAEPPSDEAIARLLVTIRRRVLRHLGRYAPSEESTGSTDRFSDEAPLLAACYASSIGQRRTLGARAGAPLERIGSDRSAPRVERRGRQQAHLEGFDLHAALRVAAQHPEGRAPLEKLLKYCARPPIAHDRLSELPDGRIALRLKSPWSDGSTHVVYEPVDFVAKLAALIPRPHKNLVLYHGVLAANSSWRLRVVRHGRCAEAESSARETAAVADPPSMRPRRAQWAELMRYAFGYELLSCPRCGCKMKLLACILDRDSIRKILTHRGLSAEPPPCAAVSGDWGE